MGSETKQKRTPRGPRKRVEPVFITKTEIGQHLGLGNLDTLDTWIGKGVFPPPHSQPGERYAVWVRKHWQHYVDHGEWPKAAWPDWKD